MSEFIPPPGAIISDVEEEKNQQERLNKPDLSKFRPAIFWDTAIERIKWETQKTVLTSKNPTI